MEQQHPIKVFDEDDTLIGDYYPALIIELKTVKVLADEHTAQVLG